MTLCNLQNWSEDLPSLWTTLFFDHRSQGILRNYFVYILFTITLLFPKISCHSEILNLKVFCLYMDISLILQIRAGKKTLFLTFLDVKLPDVSITSSSRKVIYMLSLYSKHMLTWYYGIWTYHWDFYYDRLTTVQSSRRSRRALIEKKILIIVFWIK